MLSPAISPVADSTVCAKRPRQPLFPAFSLVSSSVRYGQGTNSTLTVPVSGILTLKIEF